MNEIKHFTNNPETEGIAEVKVSENDNAYGVTWAEVVREYLKTGYAEEKSGCEVEAFGKTYKVLKRDKVTAFYDESGNTLFDVENDRLKKEYEWFAASGWPGESEDETEDGEPDETNEESSVVVAKNATGEDEDMVPMGTASLKDIVTGNVPAPTDEEVDTAKKANAGDIKAQAKQKLEDELKNAKDKSFADPVISYLLKRCEEDNGLAVDVMQEHKTWNKCFDYIYSQARKQTKGSSCAVRDNVVYEWAEDYYHKDDKAEEEAKAKKEAAEKEKRKKTAVEKNNNSEKENGKKKNSKAQNGQPEEKHSSGGKEVVEKQKSEAPKSKPKKSNELDGQLDLFSMMGM